MNEFIVYWNNYDHPCIEEPCMANSIPIIGEFTGMEDYAQIRWIAMRQESAFEYDHYPQYDHPKITKYGPKDVETIVKFKKQKAEDRLELVYPGISVATVSDARKSLKENDGSRIKKSKIFVPSTTPTQFNFTGMFLLNNGTQGVLHSFVRHHDKWAEVVPNMRSYLDRMKPVMESIQAIQKAPNLASARALTFAFLAKLGQLNNADFNIVQGALNEVQTAMVEALQKYLVYANYLGEGLNPNGQLQTYFRVSPTLVACIGFCRELFVEEPSYDPRPFRTIMTVYFVGNDEYRKRFVVKSY